MSTGLFTTKDDKNILVVIAVVIAVITSDTMINTVADFLAPQLVSDFGIVRFVLFAIIIGVSQYFILRYAKTKINLHVP